MIESRGLTKYFGEICAVDHVDTLIRPGNAFGLLGTNGAGKSTFLRLLAGILQPDQGEICVDGQAVFEQPQIKRRIFYIADEQYFFANATPRELGAFYAAYYPDFDRAGYDKLLHTFELDSERKVMTFSKGMKKQLSLFAALAANTDFLLCDETFDGLDPVVRQAVKSLLADAMASRGMTPVIASHNLRELEDICDHIGLLHRGGMLLSRDLEEMKLGLHKLQAVFDQPLGEADFPALNILSIKSRGRLQTMIIRGEEEQILRQVEAKQPLFVEMLPLSLEELFITETEVVGYEFPPLEL